MEQLNIIKELINKGDIVDAINLLEVYVLNNSTHLDKAFYLLGNAYRKQGNWQQTLNNYQRAIDLNPNSPAKEAHRMVMDILNFYNKDMYNQ
ncbi:tetratricopeptide repeat protein [Bacteroides oleiciplenus]|uniref:Uncharacterized protein n=2 Tax=Bacteroides oleiciplenus TaxID=626931 RepID=K9E107_9BACE|nr:tetratricopeptide repeat protein [Bacteroides oleiciplenus]EKU89306.1 hypothetical protein HMPREF9447_03631 [Bacteroides oleiciplenus YIT 12058]RGN35932.1 tetratricopeptide repeat protein [Bacteroides oleiciplenus]